MIKQARCIYEFGIFRLDAAKRLLLRDADVVPLTPKCVDILLALVESSGEPLSKDRLIELVWPDSFVEEGNLTYNISILRKALGERAGENQYIITKPGHGYQFVASVRKRWLDPSNETVQETSEFPDDFRRQKATNDPDEIKTVKQPDTVLSYDVQFAERLNAKETENTGSSNSLRRLVFSSVILTMVALIIILGYRLFGPRELKPITTVAVLPFFNASDNPDMDYLSEGISESLINSLSRLAGVKVISRGSSFRYKGKDIDPKDAASELGVEAIVTGRLAQLGDNLVISTELTDARDNTQIWGDH